ncbi:MAG: hypothetical protein R3190_19665, partial [Thermoanaerobaculia bacterium]|nr:hypothetical protein [Thermoanaerobaculia bacterium]
AAAAAASNDAFEAGMLLASGLLVAAAAVSAAGIRNPVRDAEPARVPVRVAAAIPNCPPLDVDCLPGEAGGPPAAA